MMYIRLRDDLNTIFFLAMLRAKLSKMVSIMNYCYDRGQVTPCETPDFVIIATKDLKKEVSFFSYFNIYFSYFSHMLCYIFFILSLVAHIM